MSAENSALPAAGGQTADTQANANTATQTNPKFFWLTVFQYGLIAAVTIAFVVGMLWRLNNLQELANLDIARGLITFVVTVGTIAIAIMLALTAIMTRDFEQRIVVGKEILTILVAVLGTIVGFYYGASNNPATNTGGANNPPPITIEAPKINRASDGALTLGANITGGTKPYNYNVTFSPETITPIQNKETDGPITSRIELPNPAPTEITVMIQGKDKTGADFAFNKDGKIKTPVPK